MCSFAIVESVKRTTSCGVSEPGIRRAVIRICGEFGTFATKVLNLGGDVAIVIDSMRPVSHSGHLSLIKVVVLVTWVLLTYGKSNSRVLRKIQPAVNCDMGLRVT